MAGTLTPVPTRPVVRAATDGADPGPTAAALPAERILPEATARRVAAALDEGHGAARSDGAGVVRDLTAATRLPARGTIR